MAIQDLEVCHVTPSAGDVAEKILPLLYFDVAWIPSLPRQCIYFHNFHHTESQFLDSIVPNLKKSLSLTLNHYLPLAGKIVVPLSSSGLPFSQYISGEDSVPLTVSVSDSDFSLLTANHPKDAAQFHDLVPQLPPPVYSSESIKFSVLAIRVTVFPSRGVSIGITHHHAIADGYCMMGPSGFIHAWSSINNLNGDSHLWKDNILPSYDRSRVQGSQTLTTSFWSHVKLSALQVHPPLLPHASNLRGTFVLSDFEIGCLKKFLLTQTLPLGGVSSYVAVTAHVWSCLAEAAAAVGEEVGEDEVEYLSVSVDCRGRLTPPLPVTYFGNCLVFVLAESTHGLLKGKAGFSVGARAIAAAIRRTLDNEKGVVDGAEAEYLRRREVAGKRLIGVSGSHRVDASGVDYGWGKTRKFEIIHIDHNGAISLIKSKQGVEVGLCMPKPKMHAFASIFKKNLSIKSNY